MIVITFQNAFNLKIHWNNIFFYFLKFIFDISTLKQSQNTKKIKFFKNAF